MKNMTRILLGALLIAGGVLYALSTLGVADISFSFDGWWAFFIIIPCLGGVFSGKDRIRSAIGVAFGVLLLLAAQGYVEFETIWKLIIPAIIVLLGIKIIVRGTGGDKGTKAEKEEMAAFCSRKLDYTDTEITLAKIGAVFGGATCNLTNAKIVDGGQLEVFCAFGGADIIVPENVNVKFNTFCLFGGVSDKREIKNPDKDVITLHVNGFCMFGGVDIK